MSIFLLISLILANVCVFSQPLTDGEINFYLKHYYIENFRRKEVLVNQRQGIQDEINTHLNQFSTNPDGGSMAKSTRMSDPNSIVQNIVTSDWNRDETGRIVTNDQDKRVLKLIELKLKLKKAQDEIDLYDQEVRRIMDTRLHNMNI